MVQISPPGSVDQFRNPERIAFDASNSCYSSAQRVVPQCHPGVSDPLDTHWLRVFDGERQTHV
jgi:hypothetical protein